MENNYYIPDITEFTQGFKFERCTSKIDDIIGCIINHTFETRTDVLSTKELWIEETVWWDREVSEEFITKDCIDFTISYKEVESDLYPNYSIEDLLKDGRIRARK